MSQTGPDDAGHASPGAAGATAPAPPGPRVDPRERVRDVEQLRRSNTDRKIAGVAGGLGRHFDVDPTVIRVILAVSIFFGGAGLLAYVAMWLLVPEDTGDRAAIAVHGDTRRILLIGIVVVAVCIAVGDAWSGWNGFFIPLGVLAVVALVLFDRGRRNPTTSVQPPVQQPVQQQRLQTPAQTPAQTPVDPSARAAAETGQTPGQAQVLAPVESAGDHWPPWAPPAPVAPVAPIRPRRRGPLLFLPTLALVAIGLGVLAIVDAGRVVPIAAYPALALAIVGVMLVTGAFVGRPGGLVALALLAALALGPAAVLGNGFSFSGEDLVRTPTTAAAVDSSYDVSTGRVRLDLTRVSDPQALAGRTVRISVDVGEAVVRLPAGINAHVVGNVSGAGQLDVGPSTSGGVGGIDETHDFASGTTGEPPLTVLVKARLGHVEVIQPASTGVTP